MSKDDIILRLKELSEDDDIIYEILCDLLISLGYDDVVDAYCSLSKWYYPK